MTTLTVTIEDKKTEKAVKAILDALSLNYRVHKKAEEVKPAERPLNKAEKAMYNRLKRSFEYIKLDQEGKIELPGIDEVLSPLENEL